MKLKTIQNIDFITLFLYFLLITAGWLNIYSSSFDGSEFSISSRYGRQLIMIFVVLFFFILFMFLEVHIIPTLSLYIYAFTILLLIFVLFVGDKTGGSRSWFIIGSFKLQPAEFAKLATALALAKLAGQDNCNMMKNTKNFAIVSFVLFLPAVLILLQGDAGSALVFAAFIFVLYRQGLPFYLLILIFIEILVFISVFFLSITMVFIILTISALLVYRLLTGRVKETVIVLLLIAALSILGFMYVTFTLSNIPPHSILFVSVLIVALIKMGSVFNKGKLIQFALPLLLLFYMGSVYSVDFVFYNILKEHQQTRLNVLFGIEKDISGVGYNVNQSKIAIGSGGLFGKGYLKGTQTKFDFVPEQDTDFIFCTVGEEWGFAGTSAIILLFTLFLLRIVQLAERQNSVYSRVFGYSLASVLFFHYAVNIAMTIGLAPVIGIPLPFFSYGGSSLFAFSIFLFIFLLLDAERNSLFS